MWGVQTYRLFSFNILQGLPHLTMLHLKLIQGLLICKWEVRGSLPWPRSYFVAEHPDHESNFPIRDTQKLIGILVHVLPYTKRAATTPCHQHWYLTFGGEDYLMQALRLMSSLCRVGFLLCFLQAISLR